MVVSSASLFGVQVVAQGIEREDQREALAELGCELGQGYLLGRPLPLPVAAQTRFLSGLDTVRGRDGVRASCGRLLGGRS